MSISKLSTLSLIIAATLASTACTQKTVPVTTSSQVLPQASSVWYSDAQKVLNDKLNQTNNTKRAKNVILMVGDGNGINSEYITRLYVGQQQGGYGDEYILPQERMPHLALAKTYNTNGQTPDSAGTATALNAGVKVKSGVIGVSEVARRGFCEDVAAASIPSFGDIATAKGKSVGIVSTARLTHATPSAVYAHSGDRNWESTVPAGCTQKDIATQLIDSLGNGNIDIALGGGMRQFIPKTIEGGKREDGKNLIAMAQQQGVNFVNDANGLQAIDNDIEKPVLGLFSKSHMSYEADRGANEPSIVDMTESAINYLSNDEDGYYLLIEGGRIDHANHDGNAYRTVTDGEAFAKAVEKAVEMTGDDTLIIVTADHAHALALNGYAGRGSDILGLAYKVNPEGIKHLNEPNLGDDGKPYTIVGYLNGTGSILKESANYTGSRPMITQEEATDPDYVQQALIPRSSESHSGADVAIYAQGPWAHLFDGTVEQNYVFHVMNYAINNGK